MHEYKLINRIAVPVTDDQDTEELFGVDGEFLRRVGLTRVGKCEVSTVFLGLDHNWCRSGPPILFETMIFGDQEREEQRRCSTWEQAEKQHREVVDELLKEFPGEQAVELVDVGGMKK